MVQQRRRKGNPGPRSRFRLPVGDGRSPGSGLEETAQTAVQEDRPYFGDQVAHAGLGGFGVAGGDGVSDALVKFERIGGVPAKDTLGLLWGSPFALGVSDLVFLAGLAIFLASYVLINFRNIAALFYSREIACSLGIHVRVHYTFMVAIIAFTVAIAMKLLGAFLIDALLVLPVLSSAAFLRRKKGQGIGSLFLLSSVSGCIFAAGGYVLAVVFDLPPGAVIAIIAGIAYAVFSVI